MSGPSSVALDAEPQALSRPWFYAGWLMVPLAALALAATLPGRTHGLSLITEPLIAETGLARVAFAQINLWATLLGAAFCLPCGWMIDRWGVRSVATGVVLGLAGSVLLLAQAHGFWSVLAAITLTRGFGQSMLSVVSIAMVSKWFGRNLSVAMGVYSVLLSVLMAASFGVVGSWVATDGWRSAWGQMALALGLCGLIFLAFVRSRPANEDREFGIAAEANRGIVPSATLGQAVLTPCFWTFAGAISFFGLVSSGLTLFNEHALAERGFPNTTFRTVVIIGLVVGMISNLATGWLARQIGPRWLLTAAMALLATALACFPLIETLPQVYAYAVANGAAGGMITVLFFAVWGRAFGPQHLGRIQSAAQSLTVLASAAGPLMVAASQDYTGSYREVFWAFAATSGLLALAAAATPVPDARQGAWASNTAKFSQPPALTTERG